MQEYLANPLLVDNKKFDFRVYVMVISLDPLIAYVADEALIRFCTEDYQKPNSSNHKDLLGHLTNFSLNKLSDKYVKSEGLENEDQEGTTKRTMTSLFDTLKKN